MLFGLIVIVGVVFLLLYMVGRSIDIGQQVSNGYWSSKRAKMTCPYCGEKGHGKEFHTPKSA
jgi:hypothetical protein